MRIHKGTYYFSTEKLASQWAEANNWPTDRIIKYGLGYAIQCGPSGNYAGPDQTPKPWRGGSFVQE